MGILDFNLDNVPEQTVADPGEVQLRIAKAEVKEKRDQSGFQICCTLEIEGHPNAAPIFHYLGLPAKADDERQKNNKLRRVKEFCQALGVPTDNPNTDDWVGRSCWALIKVETSEEYGTQNRVTRFIASQ